MKGKTELKKKTELNENLESESEKESLQEQDEKTDIYSNSVLDKIFKWDYRTLYKVYNLNPKITKTLKIISFFGTFHFWLAISSFIYILGIIFLMERRSSLVFHFGALLFSGIFASFFTMTIIKWIVKRKRPYANDGLKKYLGEDVFRTIKNRDLKFGRRVFQSFPSGHVGYWMMEMVFFQFQFGNYALIPFLIITPFIVLARIHFGVHFPTDVLSGLILGLFTGWIVTLIFYPILLPGYHFLFYLVFHL